MTLGFSCSVEQRKRNADGQLVATSDDYQIAQHLFLDTEQPFVTCKAGSTKNRKLARQYIQANLGNDLRTHVAKKAPQTKVFAMPGKYDVADMFRADLADARRAWLKAAQRDPEEYACRKQSDFLAAINHDGEVTDFHCLRHTCGAWLATAGAHPKEIQSVMRHSTITLTMDTYGHIFPGQEAATVARFPDMLTDGGLATEATGTSNAQPDMATQNGAHFGQQLDGESCTRMANAGEDSSEKTDGGAGHNVLKLGELDARRRAVATAGESTPSRIRTLNLLIKSLPRGILPTIARYRYNAGNPGKHGLFCTSPVERRLAP